MTIKVQECEQISVHDTSQTAAPTSHIITPIPLVYVGGYCAMAWAVSRLYCYTAVLTYNGTSIVRNSLKRFYRDIYITAIFPFVI